MNVGLMWQLFEKAGQQDIIEQFKAMATDISEWEQPPDLGQKHSQIIQKLKGVVDINVGWFLAGMTTFVQGALSQTWELRTLTQSMWTDVLCSQFKPGYNLIYQPPNEKLTLCVPSESNSDPLELTGSGRGDIGSIQSFQHDFQSMWYTSNGFQGRPCPYQRNITYYAPDREASTMANKGRLIPHVSLH
eukprot:Blabericola_migrator_1__4259@NODE_2303_length_2973_cov_32_539573_g1442_i0_p1_GENE_NODE_2303_length_2973_cov_32_539573_g1442_i0NODE_2303_length_2973_cov_32_539573_g1442_i0_p1_ORF_typecomplete_len189_score26_67_NODE_2303_length_2973_cov_32_539573_g1442_i017982364